MKSQSQNVMHFIIPFIWPSGKEKMRVMVKRSEVARGWGTKEMDAFKVRDPYCVLLVEMVT